MLVEVQSGCTSIRNAAPVAVERYDDEVREYYDTERADCLNMRIVDLHRDHRFFNPGRPDAVKEVVFNTTSPNSDLDIVFSATRADGMVRYSRSTAAPPTCVSVDVSDDTAPPPSTNVTYRVEYQLGKRTDGLTSVALALRAGETIDVTCDSPSTVFANKTLFLALTCNPDRHPGYVMEVCQDQLQRLLRLTVEEQSTLLPKVRVFPNDEPNNDDLYEANKALLMEALVKILTVEREVFLNVPRDVEVEEQKRRLEKLTVGLFSALDAASPTVKL